MLIPSSSYSSSTLDSRIDVGQEINVGHGKFDKNNKRGAWKFWHKFEVFVMKKPENIFILIFDNRFNKRRTRGSYMRKYGIWVSIAQMLSLFYFFFQTFQELCKLTR